MVYKAFQETIEKTEVNKLPLKQFEGNIRIANNTEELHKILPLIHNEKILGFDTESRPSFKKKVSYGVSLLQLSSKTETLLIRLHKTGLSSALINILEDPNIRKIGVAIKDDLSKLKKIRPFQPEGFIDLQDYAEYFSIQEKSLKKLAAIVLKVKVSKAQRLSNWETENLSYAQMKYASTDSWICREIYNTLRDTEVNSIQ
ncbi:MAG: 3'-5' exonuclease [Marinilabiliales bacterium]|nr:MAG: 3'-5' exonuclease [Marinilabiliales bacterium]